MPKGKKKGRKLHLSDAEKVLAGLHEIVRSGSEKASPASSLISWFMANKYWTDKQQHYARAMISWHAESKKKKWAPKARKYYLYAISDGVAVKLGFSYRPVLRMKEMQTSHQTQLSILWKYYVGTTSSLAAKQEKKLHRFCKQYRIRGEWFHPDCMIHVEQFAVKEKAAQDASERSHDAMLLIGAEGIL
jgi:CHAD domain-containing protein